MKAVRVHELGDANVLRLEEIAMPAPGPGEVLITVQAAALNWADVGRRRGTYQTGPLTAPVIPGLEGAGAIKDIGPGVTNRSPDELVCFFGPSYAESVVVPANATARIPDGVDTQTAAAVPIVFLTAWYALRETARLRPGDVVLIQAGGSGVGMAATQVAKHVGARVITTQSTNQKCQRSRELGADIAINYSTQDFVAEVMRATGNRGVDVVLESVGGEVYRRSLDAMARGGRLVSVGRTSAPVPEIDPKLLEQRGISATAFNLGAIRNTRMDEVVHTLEEILDLVRRRVFRVVISKTFPFAEAAAAHRYLEDRQTFGKVLLIP